MPVNWRKANPRYYGLISAAFAAFLLMTPSLKAQPHELRLILLDPGHPHAAQVQAAMLPGFSPEVHVYAPLGPELTAHLNSVARFNDRAANPTHWSFLVYAGPDFLQRALQEPPGNVVVLSGRNQPKIDYILSSLRAGQNVLADKPWIIESRDLPKLEAALKMAEAKRLAAYDCMTQRFDTAYQIQRELVGDPEIFGRPLVGSPTHPAVRMENLHALLKLSGNVPSLRPAWFFDIRQQGEGIADVGTHLVDLVFWTLFADQAIDYRRDVQVLHADRAPVILTRAQFERVTGQRAWPAFLKDAVKEDRLEYFSNNTALFTVRGVHVFLSVQWQYEAPEGVKDSYLTLFRGSRATIRLGEGPAEHFIPQVDVIPNSTEDAGAVLSALRTRLESLHTRYPHLSLHEMGSDIRIVIPSEDRAPEGEYFALLVNKFLGFLRHPDSLPAWENPNMIAKYYITTRAVELAREAHR
ncbi:MAG TPA: putative oxidoreductase C-terminal domain-containing protein [Bryobacteraceae bacterium]|nr:putative oxidoreductase C-terminal domain-containing protein [Bryobacteraceae bacterium]